MAGIGDDEVTELIADNLRYCDQLLRTATPVDTNGFDGTVQVIVASRTGQGAAPATWDPVPAWSTTLGREPESLTLDTDHAGLVSDDGWDSIAVHRPRPRRTGRPLTLPESSHDADNDHQRSP